MAEKLLPDKEYFSIGDVSDITQLETYVLRYWESEFNLLRPARRTSGHRKYTKNDIDLIFRIKDLLYKKNYTIAGAKKYLLDERRKKPEQLDLNFQEGTAVIEVLKSIRKDLTDLSNKLK
jgi:DNA-binding transcriptional MerR regulator